MKLQLVRVGSIEVPLPAYQTKGSAGFDLQAAISAPIVLQPGGRAAIPTGLSMAIPEGFEGQLRARSGNARRYAVTMTNSVGTIDSDYRGHIEVLVINLGQEPFTIKPMDRIAQLIIAPVIQVEMAFVDKLDDTERGAGGYGSTGR